MTGSELDNSFLPEYLFDSAKRSLFGELKQFPGNIDKRMYTEVLNNEQNIFQGDGLNEIRYMDLPSQTSKNIPVLVLSNTCDINPDNKRFFHSRLVYAPIIQLQKYQNLLENNHPQSLDAISSHINDVKRQYISQIFYLPKGSNLNYEGIVFFDQVNSLPSSYFEDKELNPKIFTLSDYGFYLLLYKLSVHFCRAKEGVNRTFLV